MDDFLIVLGVAVVLLVVLGLIFSNLPFAPAPTPLQNKTLYTFTFGGIGYQEPITSKEIKITGLAVGSPQEVSLYSTDKASVSAGYFGSQELTQNIEIESSVLSALEKVNINFKADKTNSYGNLIVFWNGEEVKKQQIKEGEDVDIEIPKAKILSENSLRVSTEPPGWMFWASTVYELKDMRVEGEYGQITPLSFEIDRREFEIFDRGELLLESISGQGERLVIKLNGQEIYNKFPPSTDKVTITGVLLGKNILSFSSIGGLFEVNGNLKLYILTKETMSERSFELSESAVQSLKDEVKLNIKVNKIEKPGDLIIKINENSIQKRPAEGLNTIYFDKNFLKVGENKLEFTATGRFDIGSVSLER